MKNYFSKKKKNPYHQRKKIIQNNQFGFHSNYSTIHQIHKITDNISSSFEKEEHCLAVFFFMSLMHLFVFGTNNKMLFKLISFLPALFYLVLKSFFKDQFFSVNHNT